MKTPPLFLTGFARFRAFLPAAASLLCLLAPPAHAAPGDLDATFGTGGKMTTDFGSGTDYGSSVAVQSDGRIVVAGSSYNASGNWDIALVRYTSTGALDTSFNGTGTVTTPIGSGHDFGVSVAVQSDGKIVVAGYSGNASGNDDIALVRYTSTGALDTSFNGTGTVTTPIGSGHDFGRSVAVQSDGRIVVAGYSSNASGNDDIALVRYTSTGALDTSFNGTGTVTTPIGGSDDIGSSVAMQSDGKIVVAGSSRNASGNFDIALVRYTGTGALDTSFNGTGTVTTPIGSSNDFGACVAVQSDGKIVVAGFSLNASGNNDDIALVRYTSTGALDTSFNGMGTVTTDFGSSDDFGQSVAVQSDGKIVVAGYLRNASGRDIALVRYTSTGALDTSFNGTGTVTTDFGSSDDRGISVAVQSDGKIVVAGFSLIGPTRDFALVRYEGDPVAPSLTLVRNADQTLSLSWTGLGTLEQTESLTAPNWQPAPIQDNPHIISTTEPMKFFRVKAD